MAEAVIAHRVKLQMGRLSEKLAMAAAVAPRQAARVEARADRIIAAEADLEREAEEVFAPHEAVLADAQAGIDELRRELTKMSNLGPLPPSDASPPDGDAVSSQAPGS